MTYIIISDGSNEVTDQKSLLPSSNPDQTFHKFRASASEDQWSLCSSRWLLKLQSCERVGRDLLTGYCMRPQRQWIEAAVSPKLLREKYCMVYVCITYQNMRNSLQFVCLSGCMIYSPESFVS